MCLNFISNTLTQSPAMVNYLYIEFLCKSMHFMVLERSKRATLRRNRLVLPICETIVESELIIMLLAIKQRNNNHNNNNTPCKSIVGC